MKDWERVYGSPGRVKWVRSLPCVACRGGPCENHHAWGEGAGRKASYKAIVPLCFGCHEAVHRIGKLSFLQKHSPLKVRARRGGKWMVIFCDTWEDAAEEIEEVWDTYARHRWGDDEAF